AMLICPWLEVKPARGRTISLGMGGKMVSSKTMNPTPIGPNASMMVTVHAEQPLRCSAAPSPAASMKSGPGPVSGVVGMVKSVDKGAAGPSQCAHSRLSGKGHLLVGNIGTSGSLKTDLVRGTHHITRIAHHTGH